MLIYRLAGTTEETVSDRDGPDHRFTKLTLRKSGPPPSRAPKSSRPTRSPQGFQLLICAVEGVCQTIPQPRSSRSR
jgi:hypothetical protein